MELDLPIVGAPLAGGPSTPQLAAAVSEAGGLGFLAAGYLTADALAEKLAATRALTDRPFGVNLFVPGPRADPAVYVDYVRGMSEPRWDDDGWDAKLALLRAEPVAVVSYTFGCPDPLPELPGEAWVTVTSPDEARAAVAAGADAVVAQGAEAGGHRGTWVDAPDTEPIGLVALLQLLAEGESPGGVESRGGDEPPGVGESRRAVESRGEGESRGVGVPVIAAGGIGTPAAVRAARALGAAAVQVGTALLLTPEAGTVAAYRERVAAGDAPTGLTRAFSGRLARGIRNRFMDEHPDAPIAYPEIHYATAQLRAEARARGDADGFNLWAGEAYPLAREAPAADIVRRLAG
ncbi:NAD(P)H-dependent flavin oxidoreductase [Solirubrobacter deserti]|uniref:Propionate 3-nitronate monooxygenase n=1 Tax=Solirubrobacter deserti TaxID=2282478 RepID=A0ABT4RPH8_9ACTN|nr:nitronate monooxygenase [Solirubrobacter deserti]MDA0140469.1 nitronate monooxygenase [Solirubrobacter deserti]